ncbi:hypothetical protein K1719_016102 [Acacia pycnantha]|nr:hypothetical protein K1719_016102 [Acacia pycnantha]
MTSHGIQMILLSLKWFCWLLWMKALLMQNPIRRLMQKLLTTLKGVVGYVIQGEMVMKLKTDREDLRQC